MKVGLKSKMIFCIELILSGPPSLKPSLAKLAHSNFHPVKVASGVSITHMCLITDQPLANRHVFKRSFIPKNCVFTW